MSDQPGEQIENAPTLGALVKMLQEERLTEARCLLDEAGNVVAVERTDHNGKDVFIDFNQKLPQKWCCGKPICNQSGYCVCEILNPCG